MSKTKQFVKKSKKPSQFADLYIRRLFDVFNNIDKKKIDRLFNILDRHRKKNKNIFVAGNGGSSSTASHMQNDINFDVMKKSKSIKPFKFLCLTDNSPSITAISNDLSYDDVFSKQIEIFGNKGDLIIVISASGNSINLLNAVKKANKLGIYSYGFLGFDGGKLKKECNDYILVPTDKNEYGLVEDTHIILNHLISHWFQVKIDN